MKTTIPLLLTASIVLMLSGCVSNDRYGRHDADSFVTEFYAWVDNIEEVPFDSNVGENVLIGVTHGAISDSHYYRGNHAFRGALIGGFLAGLITAIVEGKNTGYEYQLSAIDGDSVNVLSNRDNAQLGDCVVVRVANSVRIKPVQAERCVE